MSGSLCLYAQNFGIKPFLKMLCHVPTSTNRSARSNDNYRRRLTASQLPTAEKKPRVLHAHGYRYEENFRVTFAMTTFA